MSLIIQEGFNFIPKNLDILEGFVAYQATKRNFVFWKEKVEGYNDHFQVSFPTFSPGRVFLKMEVDSRCFKSGVELRDEKTYDILGQKNLLFTSDVFELSLLNSLKGSKTFPLHGQLKVLEKNHSLSFTVSLNIEKDQLHVWGFAETSFENLGIEPLIFIRSWVSIVDPPLKLFFDWTVKDFQQNISELKIGS